MTVPTSQSLLFKLYVLLEILQILYIFYIFSTHVASTEYLWNTLIPASHNIHKARLLRNLPPFHGSALFHLVGASRMEFSQHRNLCASTHSGVGKFHARSWYQRLSSAAYILTMGSMTAARRMPTMPARMMIIIGSMAAIKD